ncbi:hypothetical protein RI367_003303 [Sorochytrium milnesiophthora]
MDSPPQSAPPATNLTAEEAFEAQHRDHGAQHLLMLVIMLAALVGAQVGLLVWKQKHYRSFTIASLLGLAFVPLALALLLGYRRFVAVWTMFATLNSWVTYRATRTPLSSRTPRQVYRWFTVVYQICNAVGLTGYVLLVLNFFGVIQIFFDAEAAFSFALLLCFYGLYFMFHEQCIRGWCIIGKKDSCPYCKEKVDMKMFKVNTWNEAEMRYLQFIDWLRYLIVWQPLILFLVQARLSILGLYYVLRLD